MAKLVTRLARDQVGQGQAVPFSELVEPNKLYQFLFIDFHYLQNQSFPNIANIKSTKSNYFKFFKNYEAQKQIGGKKKNCSKFTKYLYTFKIQLVFNQKRVVFHWNMAVFHWNLVIFHGKNVVFYWKIGLFLFFNIW